MLPKGKKARKKNVSSSSHKIRPKGNEKENIYSENITEKEKIETYGSSIKLQSEKTKTKNSKTSVLLPLKQELQQKAVGFWSKKVQDLELEEGADSQEKCSPYEFNGSEESKSYQFTKTKKAKQRTKVARRKKSALSKCKKSSKWVCKVPESQTKEKQIHMQSLLKKQTILCKEGEKLTDKDKKFTFSTEIQCIGITSTPSANKDNLIGGSNFLFLSPIVSVNEVECHKGIFASTPLKSKAVERQNDLPFGIKTLKADTEMKNLDCRRILRNGKVLNP